MSCAPFADRLAAAELDNLCDALLERIADGRADDDIALLALRVRADGSHTRRRTTSGEPRPDRPSRAA